VEFWDSGGHSDAPVGMVDESVVSAAEGDAVCEAGGAMVGPVHDVVDVTPAGRYETAGISASTVSDDHRAADRGRHGGAGSPDIQRLTAGTQHHRNDPCITRDPAGDLGVDRTTQRQ
jgi:hypothetical protein